MVARRNAAAFYLDALDKCDSDSERQACYAAASQALEAEVRPDACPVVTRVSVLPADPVRYQTGFGISAVGGPGFLVTEVSCGCRQRLWAPEIESPHLAVQPVCFVFFLGFLAGLRFLGAALPTGWRVLSACS